MDDRQEIPREFYSDYSDQPFRHCIDCGCDLFESEVPYTIAKHIVATETVFEMAICFECAVRLRKQYSEQTTRNIESHMNGVLQRLAHEAAQLDEERPMTSAHALSNCAMCTKPRCDSHRYEIVGLFFQDQLMMNIGPDVLLPVPMMACGDCISSVNQLISKKTRDAWDRFVEEHFDGPPGIEIDGPKIEPILF